MNKAKMKTMEQDVVNTFHGLIEEGYIDKVDCHECKKDMYVYEDHYEYVDAEEVFCCSCKDKLEEE